MKDLIYSILNIFRYTGRIISLIRNTVINILFLLIIAIVISSIFLTGKPEIARNSILNLNLSGDIVEERRPSSPFDGLVDEMLGLEQEPQQLVLQDILDVIATAAKDPAINSILLDLKKLGRVGLDQMQTIGSALDNFRNAGKKVYAAQDIYTQRQYYLASYADTIILNPFGGVELHGFGSFPLYFKDAIDKLKVNYHVFRVGSYKSAIEPITRNSMSDEARQQNSQWLSALWTHYRTDVTSRRGLPENAVTEYIENISTKLAATTGDTARLALENGLVDRLMTREELNNFLKAAAGTKNLNLVSLNRYTELVEPSFANGVPRENGIGIIIAEGNILGGNQPPGVIGSETLAKRLRKAREDSSIKAVVLRINSGGGSAFASEIIRQEILELKKTGKPVVVSMGTMAASGGYWISADADEIWASPVTITGSIGIFGAIPTFESTLAELGIYSDGVGTTSLSAGMNLAQPMNQQLKESIQLTVNNGYNRFLELVGKARNIAPSDLPRVAEGRVFSGERAKELKLVDKLGSFTNAIGAAANLAGLDLYTPVYIDRDISVRDKIFQHLSTAAVSILPASFIPQPLQDAYDRLYGEIRQLIFLDDPHGIYAHSMLQISF